MRGIGGWWLCDEGTGGIAMISFGRRGAGGGTRFTSTFFTSVLTDCQ